MATTMTTTMTTRTTEGTLSPRIPSVEIKEVSTTLEDLLATDILFIDYFNTFLALPVFPEPLCFNKETGGFEVLTDAKARLVREIKTAVRAGRTRPAIYRPSRNHSYCPIPLIPIDDVTGEERKEIDTSFTVQALNKEQGIEWIKRERLPTFLESDCYIEYRLAKLVAQAARGAQQQRAFISMKIDYASHVDPEAEVAVKEQNEVEDESVAMMKTMFVSLGNVKAADTEAWVSQAKIALTTHTSSASRRPITSPVKYRQATNDVSSHNSQSKRRDGGGDRDSGYWSPPKAGSIADVTKATAGGSSDISSEDDGQKGEDKDRRNGIRVFDPDARPVTARMSDPVCSIDSLARETSRLGHVTMYLAADSSRTSGSCQRQQELSNGDMSPGDSLRLRSDCKEGSDTIVLNSLDELGHLLVRRALAAAMMEVKGSAKPGEEKTLSNSDSGQGEDPVVPGKTNIALLTDTEVERLTFLIDPTETKMETTPPTDLEEKRDETPEVTSSGGDDVTPGLVLGKDDKDSDDESLLNSDEDYEDERDVIFRTRQDKTYSLSTKKGQEHFFGFLRGTQGERNWFFWQDIERAKMIQDSVEQASFVNAMRARYQTAGGPLELSGIQTAALGLQEPSDWTVQALALCQNMVIQPLLHYWSPRFVLKQNSNVDTSKNMLYHHQRSLLAKAPDVYPTPPVVPLLPLRPKTCMPGVRREAAGKEEAGGTQAHVADVFPVGGGADKAPRILHDMQMTTPPVGMKRTYSLPDMFAASHMKSHKERQNRLTATRKDKTPRELITASLSVPVSGRVTVTSPALSTTHSLPDMTSPTTPRQSSAGRGSRRNSSVSECSDQSEFCGGRRMEGLLQALATERKSGGFFRKKIDLTGNQLWKNALDFWEDLQEYHGIFYAGVLDPYRLKKKAKFLYSHYITVGATKSINCSDELKEKIHAKIDPPFEELFDGAEEYVFSLLFDAWSESIATDIQTFDKIELVKTQRHLSTKSKYVVTLEKRGIIKERPLTPDSAMVGYSDPVYDESILEEIPEEFRNFTLDRLVRSRVELEHYREFLSEHFASTDLMCWMDIEAFRRIPHADEKRRDQKAIEIKKKYFNKKYFFGPNSPAGKEGQEKVIAAGGGWGKLLGDRPPTACLLEAQVYVAQRLEKKWMPLFLATEGFAERQRPRSGMDDVVEDVMMQRKKKSQAIWKLLESRWVSSSKDILTFRKALSNPVTSHHFRRFLSAKYSSDHFYENDVLFWQEVQRYKDLCHLHSDRALAQQKTTVIVNCWVESPIPPSLQIDIPQEMAEAILDRKLEASPYLFREAQLTVFRLLFPRWQEFCQFRSNLADDRMTPTLQRLRRKNKTTERKKQRETQARRERDLTRRRDMGLAGEGSEGSDKDFDPFEKTAAMSDDGSVTGHAKESITWSYSQYLTGLDREEVLNEVDESIFSSTGGSTEVAPDGASKTDEKSTSLSPSNPKESTKERKPSKPTATEGDQDNQNNNMMTTNSASQTETKSKRKVRVLSPNPPVADHGPERPLATEREIGGRAKSRGEKVTSNTPAPPRMSRKMPPLVSQPK